MAANDLYELTQFSKIGNNKIVNRFILQDDGGGGTTPEADIMAGHIANVIPAWLDSISQDCTITGLSCRRVYPTGGPTFEVAIGSVGLYAEDTSVPQVVAVLQFFTSNFTRRGRGRTHVSGVPENRVQDGLLTNAVAGKLALVLGAIVTGFGAFSYVVADPALGSFAQINDGNIQSHTYTLRSRRMQQA
jgi:hypothetical protein